MIYGYFNGVQVSVALKAAAFGYICGFIYCFSLIFKSSGMKKIFLDAIRDIVFFVFTAVLTYMFFLKYNAGIFRFYIIASELLGFIIYKIFPGKIIEDKINYLYIKK